MHKYFIGAFAMMITLILYISYQQNLLFTKTIPNDYEQTGLSKQIIIHFSHVVAEHTPKGEAAQYFASLVEQKSNGQMKVFVYPNGILYNDDTEIEALEKNRVQMIARTTSKMTEYLPSWQLFDLPFLIETDEQLKQAITGETAQQLLDELERYNIKGLGFWRNGFKHITSRDKPLLEPSDFQEVKIRTMTSPLIEKQFSLLGAHPLPSSFGDVYKDLAQNKVDAQENTASNIYSKGFYTVQNHITLSQHGTLNYAVMMNGDFWDSLSSKQQQIIQDAIKETSDWQIEQAQSMNEDSLEKLAKSSNIAIHTLTKKQLSEWKKTLAPLYDDYNNKVNATYIQQLQNDINFAQ